MPDGGENRKGDLAWEVCTNHHMIEVENFRLGPKTFSFYMFAGVEDFRIRQKPINYPRRVAIWLCSFEKVWDLFAVEPNITQAC